MKIIAGILMGLIVATAGIAGCIGSTGDNLGDGSMPTAVSPTTGDRPFPSDGIHMNATRPEMDLASVAANLGVTEEQLRDALGMPADNVIAPGEPGTARRAMLNWTRAAEKLGVSEEELVAAMRMPGGMGNQTAPRGPFPRQAVPGNPGSTAFPYPGKSPA